MAVTTRVAESRQRLWIVPAPLVIWGIHFLACYATAAIWCGRIAGRLGALSTARLAILIYTMVALAAIVGIAWLGYRAHALPPGEPPHDADSPEDRHRFLGLAALLISGLSAVAVVYSAMAAAFIRTCE